MALLIFAASPPDVKRAGYAAACHDGEGGAICLDIISGQPARHSAA